MPMEPKNAPAEETRDLSPEARAVVDRVNSMVGEVRSAFEDKLRAMRDDLAKLELLSHEDARASLLAVAEMESSLDSLCKAQVLERLDELERVQQLREKEAEDPLASDPRVEAFKMFEQQLATNGRLRTMLQHDPRLTVEYEEAVENYFARGGKVLPSEQAKVLGKGLTFAQGVLQMDRDQVKALLTPEALNALSTDWEPGGGIFVSPTMEARVLRKITEQSPLLAIAGQKTTTSSEHKFTIETGHLPTTHQVGERQIRPDDDSEDTFWEAKSIHIHEQHVTVLLTRAQIQDSATDIVSELETLASRSMGRDRSRKVISGSGINEPEGMFASNVYPVINTGSATTLPLWALDRMHIELLPEYLGNAQYLFSIGALLSVMLDRDGIGRPLWEPSQQDGTPSLFRGFRWVRDPYMDREQAVNDENVTFATGAKPVAFGDFAQAFWLVNRQGLQVIRDEVTKKGFVGYTWYARYGAGPALPDAIRILQVAA